MDIMRIVMYVIFLIIGFFIFKNLIFYKKVGKELKFATWLSSAFLMGIGLIGFFLGYTSLNGPTPLWASIWILFFSLVFFVLGLLLILILVGKVKKIY